MINELKVRKAIRKYLGRDHNFGGDILDDAWSEMRWMEFVAGALDQTGITDEEMETEDKNGDVLWHHAVDEVQRQFLVWLVKQNFTKDEIKKVFHIQ